MRLIPVSFLFYPALFGAYGHRVKTAGRAFATQNAQFNIAWELYIVRRRFLLVFGREDEVGDGVCPLGIPQEIRTHLCASGLVVVGARIVDGVVKPERQFPLR